MSHTEPMAMYYQATPGGVYPRATLCGQHLGSRVIMLTFVVINSSTMSEPTLKVSFIIPVYNLPVEMVRECIESIRALSLGEHEREIIVVDDGSDIPLMVSAHAAGMAVDDIIHVRQKNAGPAAARNTGLRMAGGTHIQFVDGDDCLLTAPYEHCLDIARQPAPDIVMFNMVTRQHHKQPATFADSRPMSGSDYMRRHNLRPSAWGYLFRRSVLGSLRFDESLSSDEDEDFTPRLMLRATTLIDTSARAYYYRRRSGSLINDHSAEHVADRLRNVEHVIFGLQDTLLSLPDMDRAAMARRVAQLTMGHLYNVMRLTRSPQCMEQTVERLRARGLFPLPDRGYTRKYSLFRAATAMKAVRPLMVRLMP